MNRKTLTILFVDLQGYTSRTASQSRGDNELLIQELRSFIKKHTAEYGGTFVKAMGDGFLLTFESPTDAVTCGQSMQTRIEQRNSNVLNKDNFLKFRIGISTGEVTLDEDGDVYGDAVNIASRIQGFAEPNDVFISEATYLAMNRSEINAMDLGPKMFKNALKEIRVYKVVPGSSDIISQTPIAKQSLSLRPLLVPGIIVLLIAAITIFMLNRAPDIEKLFEREDYPAVVELGQELLKEDPENLRLHELVIVSMVKTKQFPHLKTHLREAWQTLPEPLALCPPVIESLEQEGAFRIARTIAQRHCEPEPFDRNKDDRFRQGRDKNMRQRPPEEQSFRDQERPDPGRWLDEGDYDKVIQFGEQVLERDPDDIGARNLMTEAFMRAGDLDRAEEMVRQTLEINPRDQHALFYLGQIHQEKGEIEEALGVFTERSRTTRDDLLRREAQDKILELEHMLDPDKPF